MLFRYLLYIIYMHTNLAQIPVKSTTLTTVWMFEKNKHNLHTTLQLRLEKYWVHWDHYLSCNTRHSRRTFFLFFCRPGNCFFFILIYVFKGQKREKEKCLLEALFIPQPTFEVRIHCVFLEMFMGYLNGARFY